MHEKNKNKRAKRALISTKPVTYIKTIYQCPACRTFHEGSAGGDHVLRVRCLHCGQELILRD